MKKIILIFITIPLIMNGQNNLADLSYSNFTFNKEENQKRRNITLLSYICVESDDLNSNFAKTMLFGGFITDEMKTNWISSGDEVNRLNAEIKNTIQYQYRTKNFNGYYIEVSDINLLNSTFNDDLLRLTLEGNYNYQDETLDFSNTVFRADRYQQYKLGFLHAAKNISVKTAVSYLSGNHHSSYIINQGQIYTAPLGSFIDLNYDMTSLVTDTSLFAQNGKGIAAELSILYSTKKDEDLYLSINDLGYINWNNNSVVSTADSVFSFSGIEIEDFDNIISYNDSITQFKQDEMYSSEKKKFRSFIPARIIISYKKKVNQKYIKNIIAGFQCRWHPYEVNGPISFDLIKRGIKESGYNPSFNMYATLNTKYILVTPGINTGGFTDNIKFHLSISNKKGNIALGTYHLESLFNNNKTSLSVCLKLSKQF